MGTPTTTTTTSTMRTNFEHLKRHVNYPTDRKGLIAACNSMMDVAEADRAWFTKNVPEGTYKTPEDVVKALLAKV